MRFACVDTSTFTESVALVEGDILWGERNVRRPYGHAPGLHADLRALLQEVDWSLESLDALVIGVGPGSFTGLRVGMAAMKGLAYALEKPLYGVNTAKALLAALADTRESLALIDARRGEIYAYGDLLIAPQCLTPEQLIEHLQRLHRSPRVLVGEGAAKYRVLFEKVWPNAYIPQNMASHLPRAALLAVNLETLITSGEVSADHTAGLEPIYVRKSDAEINYPNGFPSESRLFK